MLGHRSHRRRLCAFLGAASALAFGAAPADAAMTVSKLRLGSASGFENYAYTAGDTIYAQGSVDTPRFYRFVISDPSGAVRAATTCRLTSTGSVSNSYVVQADDALSAGTAWRYRLEQHTTSTCSSTPEKSDQLYFTVARATAYSDAAATLPKSAFAAATTAYVQVAGLGKVKASATNAAVNDWKVTWVLPSGGGACANTGGGDRPDSTASGLLPASSIVPGTGSTLRYRPFTTATGDTWNRQSSYDGACPDLSAANEGQWRIKLQRDNTHFVVLPAFRVDATAPDTSITGGPSGTTRSTTAAFTLGSTESPATFECKLDTAAWGPCTSPASLSGLANGPHTFSVRSTDLAGNVDATPATRSWTVDSTVPAVTLVSPANDSWTNDQTPTFTGNAGTGATDGPVTVKVYAGLGTGGSPVEILAATGSPAWSATADPALPEGTYTAQAEQADSAGLGVSEEHTFRVDTTAPTVTLISPTGGMSTSDPNPTIRGTLGTATGDAGTVEVELYAGSSATGSPVQTPVATTSGSLWSASPATLTEGTYTASVRQVDAAGNASTVNHTFRVDLTAPDTAIGASPAGATASTRASFEFASAESGVTFQCRLDGGMWTACTSGKAYTGLSEGVHTFEVRAVDAAGNVDPEPELITWTINLALPLVDVVLPGEDAVTTDTTPTLSGTAGTAAGDAATVTVKIYAAESPATPVQTHTAARSASGAWTTTATLLADGSYFARAEQESAAGVATSPARSFRVDTGAPQTSITVGMPGPTSSLSATFAFSADEAGVSFECRLDSGAWSACSSPASYTGLGAGSHTFSVRAIDSAGNVDATPATQTWTVDPTLPAVSLTQPANGTVTNDTTPSLAGTAGTLAGDAGDVTVRIHTGASTADESLVQSLVTARSSITGAWAVAASPPLEEGVYTAYARQAGTSGTGHSSARTFTVDTTPPQTTLLVGPQGTTGSRDPRFSFSASEDDVSYECRLDGGAWQACEPPAAYSDLAVGDHTFEVRAIDAAGNVDPTPLTREWTIDTSTPLTLAAPAQGAVTNDATPALAGAASTAVADAAEVTVEIYAGESTLDAPVATVTTPRSSTDGSWSTSSPALPDGVYTAFAKQADALGENAVYTAAHTFRVDTAAPAPEILSPAPDAVTADTTPKLSGLAGTSLGDATSLTVRIYAGTSAGGAALQTLPGVAITSGLWNVDAASLPDGTYTARADQTDSAANSGLSVPATFVVDSAAPDTAIDSGPSGSVTATSAAFDFSSADSGVTFECRLDAGQWGACESPAAYTGLGEGEHTFRVRATDAAGNTDPTPATRTWTVLDTTAPDTALDAGPTGSVTATAAAFDFSSEPGATFECRLDADAWGSCESPKEYTGLGEGEHTFRVRASDGAGNVDPTPAIRTWTVLDTTAPDTAIDTGPSGPQASTAATFAFSSEAGASFECRVDSGDWAACDPPKILTGLAVGDHTFLVRAIDQAGNVDATPATRSWSVLDTAAPDTALDSGPTGTVGATGATFEFSSEPGATFECRLDAGGWAACESPQAYTDLPLGEHTFRVRAVDSVGNVDATPATRTWTVADLTAPDTALDNGPTGTVGITGATFEFSSEPGATFECRLDAGDWTACESPQAYTDLPLGEHTFRVRAVDAAANVDATPATRTWTVADLTAPDTTIDNGPTGSVVSSTATFEFSSEAGATFECRLDAGAWGACESPKTYTGLAAGQHSFRVRAVDAAANVDATPALRTWTVVVPDAPVDPGPTTATGSGAGGSGGDASAGQPAPVEPAPAADITPPSIDRVSIARTFTVTRKATAVSAKRRRFRRGTAISFQLSEQAAVTITIQRALPGRRRGKSCRKPSRKLAKGKRCLRYKAAGSLTRRSLAAGVNKVAFSGRVGRRALRAGLYRAVLSATDAAGNRSLPRTVRFRVAKAPKRKK